MEKQIRILESQVAALEEALDSAKATNELLRQDVDTITLVLTNLIKKLEVNHRQEENHNGRVSIADG